MRPGARFERKIRNRIRDESGFTCEKRDVIGESGNIWEVDAVIFNNDSAISYIEVKYVGKNSSYDTQYRLALAQLADFRYSNVPGAVVVPHKKSPGKKDWEDYLATIGCVLIDETSLGNYLDALQEFPTAPDTDDPLENFISEKVWENVGNEPLQLAEQNTNKPNETVERLQDIYDKFSDSH